MSIGSTRAISQSERMKNAPLSSIRNIIAYSDKLEQEGRSIIHLELGEPDFGTPAHIIDACKKALDNQEVHYGPIAGTVELRKALSRHCTRYGLEYAPEEILVSTGVVHGVFLSMLAYLDPGDEILVPDPGYLIYFADPHIAQAKPVSYPLREENGFQLDAETLEALITPRTKAIIPVDVGGILCDYTRIFSIVEDRRGDFSPASPLQAQLGRIAVIADGAHSFGAVRGGIRSGAWADFTTFSFHAVKNLTTAEGGAVTWRRDLGLDDAALYRRYMLLSLHGQDKDALAKTKAGAWEYDIVAPLYKCNMTDIMAAIGLAQLHRYEELLAKRYALVEQYHELLASTAIRPARHLTEDGRSSCHLYLTELEGKTLSQRNAVIDALAQQGIASNVHYKPLPLLTAYRDLGFRMEDYPNAYGLYERELTLPLYSTLTQAQAERICGALREIL